MIAEQLQINTKTLSGWLKEKKPVTILDVRPASEREEWSIPGSIHADVYDRLKAGEKEVFNELKLPGAPVVTICAAGKTSMKAAEQLREKGYEVYSLEGGMKAWNYAWNTAETSFENFEIIQVRRSAKGCLSYLVGSGGEAAVIDASLDPQVYMDLAQSHGWQIRYVMDTHVHADYISRTRELAAASGAKHLFVESAKVDYSFGPVKDSEKLKLGKVEIEVLHTPGHTPESTSYLVGGKALLTGDTLFTDGVGRPDLKASKEEAAGKASSLYESLQRIMKLPADTMVMPAHLSHAVHFDGQMIESRLADLRTGLELLQLSKSEFMEATMKRIPPTPPNYQTIAELNRKGDYSGHVPADLEAGANRCAIA